MFQGSYQAQFDMKTTERDINADEQRPGQRGKL